MKITKNKLKQLIKEELHIMEGKATMMGRPMDDDPGFADVKRPEGPYRKGAYPHLDAPDCVSGEEELRPATAEELAQLQATGGAPVPADIPVGDAWIDEASGMWMQCGGGLETPEVHQDLGPIGGGESVEVDPLRALGLKEVQRISRGPQEEKNRRAIKTLQGEVETLRAELRTLTATVQGMVKAKEGPGQKKWQSVGQAPEVKRKEIRHTVPGGDWTKKTGDN